MSRDDALHVLRCHGLTLPTEAQWEFATRAGTHGLHHWGDGQDGRDFANTAHAHFQHPCPPFADVDHWDGRIVHARVGRLQPNAFGLFDTEGNVSEWCLDAFGAYWSPVREGDGLRLSTWTDRAVARGSNFSLGAEVHNRVPFPPDAAFAQIGVRCARGLEQQERRPK